MSVFQYNPNPSSNTAIDGINIGEGMAPGNVNNAMRSMMADTRKLQLDIGGNAVSAGSGNAYTLTVQQNFVSYANGMRFLFRADRSNTGVATLNVNGVGPVNFRIMRNGAMATLNNGDIQQGGFIDVVYSAFFSAFVILNRQSGGPENITMTAPGVLGRSTPGAGPARILTPSDGIEVNGVNILAKIGAGLQFVTGAIVAVVQKFATQAEALAGAVNDAAMTPLRTAQHVDARTIGRAQSWQDVTASRSANTTYQNTTGSPIQVITEVGVNSSGTFRVGATTGSLVIVYQVFDWDRFPLSVIIPAGHYYRFETPDTPNRWTELR